MAGMRSNPAPLDWPPTEARLTWRDLLATLAQATGLVAAVYLGVSGLMGR